jgi:hypothetical protein
LEWRRKTEGRGLRGTKEKNPCLAMEEIPWCSTLCSEQSVLCTKLATKRKEKNPGAGLDANVELLDKDVHRY